jgi:predicted RNase H-related nuclease YkuK (DUF458 family)
METVVVVLVCVTVLCLMVTSGAIAVAVMWWRETNNRYQKLAREAEKSVENANAIAARVVEAHNDQAKLLNDHGRELRELRLRSEMTKRA